MTKRKSRKKTKKKIPKINKVTKVIKVNPIVSIFIVMPLILLTPYFLISGLPEYSELTNKQSIVSQRIDDYSNGGWNTEEIEKEYDKYYFENDSYNYLVNKFFPNKLQEIENKLEFSIDTQTTEIYEEKAEIVKESSNLYMDEISQDTHILEELLDIVDEGVTTENYILANWALDQARKESIYLSELQDEDIEQSLARKVSTIESMKFIGLYYGLDFSNEVAESKEIAQTDDAPLEKFLKLDNIKEEAAQKLNQKIIARGGKVPTYKWIFISIGRQRLYMIEDYNIIYDMPASTGIHGHGTAVGEFQVYEKVDMAWGYYEIWMPYWLTVYYSGGLENGIHGIPISPVSGRWNHWESVVGVRPITYGCIMPLDNDAKKVYEWAEVGTTVSIHY